MRLQNLALVAESSDVSDAARENALLRAEIARLTERLEELERLAATDTLTPLANRRVFIREIERVIGRYERYATPAAILFVDVDGLKQINDRFGHLAGDAALIQVARVLAQGVRTTDLVARIGGDEFGLVLDHLGEAEARTKADMLANCIALQPLRLDTVSIPISLSIGVASVVGGDSADALLARADADMYGRRWGQRSER